MNCLELARIRFVSLLIRFSRSKRSQLIFAIEIFTQKNRIDVHHTNVRNSKTYTGFNILTFISSIITIFGFTFLFCDFYEVFLKDGNKYHRH